MWYSASSALLKIGKAPAAPFLPVLKPEAVTAPDPQTVRIRLEKPYGPFFAAVPMVMIVNEKLVRAHDKDGDWGAAWLASNDAGSGSYRLIPETYVPLEKVDMERNEAHFMGWGAQPEPDPPGRDPADQGNLDPGAGPAQRLARPDRHLSAGRSGREHRKVAWRMSPATRRCASSSFA